MRVAILAVFALCACAGFTQGNEQLKFDGGPGATNPGNSPDASDAGIDGGADAGQDAGCTALMLSAAGVIDNCIGTDVLGTASVNVTVPSCSVSITSTTGTACNGFADGGHDAFDGGCNSMPCTSASLPGTIVCVSGAMSSCTIVVDGGP